MANISSGMTAEVCVPQETVIYDPQLAHAYVPFQKLCELFSPMDALRHGTAFPPLTNYYWNYWNGRGRRNDPDEQR